MNELPMSLSRRARWGSGMRAFRASCSFAALVLSSGCLTQTVWEWAGEGRYAFVPARVTSLGLLRQEDQPDRLFYRVEAPADGEQKAEGPKPRRVNDEGEVYVVEVPEDWKSRPTILVPDEAQPGTLQLTDLLAAKSTASLPGADLALLTPVPLRAAGRFPALDAGPYAYIEGPPGILFLYGADDERGRWVRLSSAITGEVISTPAPKLNYAIAVAATPVTAAVDAVGVVFYAILWPLWASMDIEYGDYTGYRPDGSYQPGRPPREERLPEKEDRVPVSPPEVLRGPAEEDEGS